MTTEYKPMPPAPNQVYQDTYVGKDGFLKLGKLQVEVHIFEIRNRFGNIDALVSPVAGQGRQWVKADRVRLPS